MWIDILCEQLAFPEGPAFAPDGSLWLVELEGGMLSQWNRNGLTRRACGGQPNGMAIDHNGRAWVCDAGRSELRRYSLPEATGATIAATIDHMPLLMPNDLAFDARGNLLFTCPGADIEHPAGYVCCLQPNGTITRIAEGMYFPNGLAFSDNGQTLVIAETYRQRLWKGSWDAIACCWIAAHPWAEVGGTTDGPDGMAYGANGLLYVAIYSLGCIKAVAPDGSTVATYMLPGQNPTNCTFDPAGTLGLVVTEAERGMVLSLPELGPGLPLFDGGHAWPGD